MIENARVINPETNANKKWNVVTSGDKILEIIKSKLKEKKHKRNRCIF